MKRRAQALREAARKAKAMASPLGTHVDQAVTSATEEGVWHGPYAVESTRSLLRDQKNLRELAADLVVSADSWIREADKLEAAAKAAEPAPK
jgi:hypothetical protein